MTLQRMVQYARIGPHRLRPRPSVLRASDRGGATSCRVDKFDDGHESGASTLAGAGRAADGASQWGRRALKNRRFKILSEQPAFVASHDQGILAAIHAPFTARITDER